MPQAISWLPHAVQRKQSAKVTLGQAIVEAAVQTGNDGTRIDDSHLVQLAPAIICPSH